MFNVLLVDDEELALTSLRYILPWKEYGFTDILFTTSPQEACKILREKRIDAAFIDIRMPDMTGFQLLDYAQQYNLDTIFIIVSGYSDFSYAKQAFRYGVFDYCLKPIVKEECLPVLQKLFNKIICNRISEDPAYVSRLLRDMDFCQDFLFDLSANDTECSEWTLLLVRSSELISFLKQVNRVLPAKVFFLDNNLAFLIWMETPDTDEFVSLLRDWEDSALLIYSTTPANVVSFQSTFKRLRAICHSKSEDTYEIVRLYKASEENAIYFSSILSYIEANYAKDVTLSDLARQFGISYSYMSQLFKKTIGLSFAEHLSNVRLMQACSLLCSTDMPVADISEAVGYNDYHYFCNAFKKRYSMTPTQYRNLPRKEIEE